MAAKTNILTDDLRYIYDKKTGEKFFKQSTLEFCRITHYSIKSEKTGETLLLSADGIKRRFAHSPNIEHKKTKDIFSWFNRIK